MKKLDLHGTRHVEADEKIRTFLNFVDLPCQIITGNSTSMKSIVKKIVKEYDWFCYERDSYNYGTLIIVENHL